MDCKGLGREIAGGKDEGCRRWRYSFILLGALALFAEGSSWAASRKQAKALVVEPLASNAELGATTVADAAALHPLPEVLSSGLTGLPAEASAERKKLVAQAEQFLNFKRRRMSATDRKDLVAACRGDSSGGNPFCPAVLDDAEPVLRSRRDRSKLEHQASKVATSHRLLRSLETGDYASAEKHEECDLTGALKPVRELKRLDKVLVEVLAPGKCTSSRLLTALGMKMEGWFPEPRARDLALTLYQRSSNCGDDTSAVRARYRLALLFISERKFTEAEAVLAQVVDHPAAQDYRSRAVYWRLQCARKSGNKLVEKQMLAKLRKDHSMSLHGLLAAGGNQGNAFELINSKVPLVRFRSQKFDSLNSAVIAAEALQLLDAPDAAFDALASILDRLADAESEFRLYVAVLLMRSGDTLKKFSLLTGLFKERPELVTKSTLEMLYPLRQFEVVRGEGSNQNVDPFLVLSLIRQESAFNVRARSRAGAIGLMQLMPGTARIIARVSSKQKLFDPAVNVRVGVKYFSRLMTRYSGDVKLALAAYNAGPERVDEWLKRYPVDNHLLFLDLIPYRETREYVASIARNYYWYLKLYSDHDATGLKLESRAEKPRGSQWPLVMSLFRAGA